MAREVLSLPLLVIVLCRDWITGVWIPRSKQLCINLEIL